MRDFGLKPHAKGWRQTVGAIPDDELFRHAEKLRREWREQANKDWYRSCVNPNLPAMAHIRRV